MMHSYLYGMLQNVKYLLLSPFNLNLAFYWDYAQNISDGEIKKECLYIARDMGS